jgi:hypothetical protein
MGATRESSWSGEILAACCCGEAAWAEWGDGVDASVSPGAMAIVQRITRMYRKGATQNFCFEFMATSALDRTLELDGWIEHRHPHLVRHLPR